MATLPGNQFEDDDPNAPQQLQGQQVGAGGVVGAGAGTPGAGGQGRRTRAGGYVGIQNYLGAQGNAGERLAQNVGQNITQQTEQAQQAVGGVQSQFQQQAEASRAGPAGDLQAQLKADPTKISQGAWQKATGGYGGPQDLTQIQGYGEAAGQAQRAEQALGQTASTAGQTGLLKDQFGRPSYTGGQSRLDAAILGSSQGSRERFQQLRQQLGGQASGALTQAQEQSAALGQQYGQEAEATKTALEQALSGERSALQSGLESGLAKTRGQQQSEFEKLQGLIGRSFHEEEITKGGINYDPEAAKQNAWRNQKMKELGLSGLGKADALKHLKLRQAQGVSDVATDQQRSRDAALARLAGGNQFITRDAGKSGLTTDAKAIGRTRKAVEAKNKASAADYRRRLAAKQAKEDAARSAQLRADEARKAKGIAARKAKEKAKRDRAARIKAHQEGVRRHKQQMAAQGTGAGSGYTGQ